MSIDRAVFSCSSPSFLIHPLSINRSSFLPSFNVIPFVSSLFFLSFRSVLFFFFLPYISMECFACYQVSSFSSFWSWLSLCAHFCVTLVREVAGLTHDVHASRSRLVVEGKARCAPFPERNIQSSPVGQSAPQKGAKNEARRSVRWCTTKRLYIKYQMHAKNLLTRTLVFGKLPKCSVSMSNWGENKQC